jgi:lysophospholipase L1-like esterase
MKSLLKNLCIACIPLLGVILALGVVEIAVRLFLPAPNSAGPGWNDRPLFYFRSPAAPSMQDYPYQKPKAAERFRIAAIGDSFTFAPYMQFTDTYVKKLESMLNIKDGVRAAEVINYGVPAYSTSHEVSVTNKAIEEGADIILLQITLNDPEIKRHTPSGIRENMDDRFGALKMTGLLGSVASYWKTLAYVMTRLHNTKTHRAYTNYFTDLFENPRTWNPFVESMRTLVGTARGNKKPIVAVVFPLFGIPMTDSYPFHAIHAKVNTLMQELQVPLLDLSVMYKGIPLERLQVIPGVDRHPNEIAHRMAAEKIYLWLESLNLIPPAHLIPDKFATRLGIDAQRPWEPVAALAPTYSTQTDSQ